MAAQQRELAQQRLDLEQLKGRARARNRRTTR
jgi:hypothetical protein